MKLITNGHDYELYAYHEVPRHIQKDYAEKFEELGALDFFKYKGTWYSTSDFLLILTDTHPGWHGYYSLGAFASVLVRISPDGTTVKVATLLH